MSVGSGCWCGARREMGPCEARGHPSCFSSRISAGAGLGSQVREGAASAFRELPVKGRKGGPGTEKRGDPAERPWDGAVVPPTERNNDL